MLAESRELAEGIIDPEKRTLTLLWDKSDTHGVEYDRGRLREKEIAPFN